jgi:hypothetical protein
VISCDSHVIIAQHSFDITGNGTCEMCRYHAKSQQRELDGFDIGWKLFPHPVQEGQEVMGAILGVFLFSAALFGFVTTVGFLTNQNSF